MKVGLSEAGHHREGRRKGDRGSGSGRGVDEEAVPGGRGRAAWRVRGQGLPPALQVGARRRH